MKILVCYDGSNASEHALNDLKTAGLPEKGVEVLVFSVAEVWMPPPQRPNGNGNGDGIEDEQPVFIKEWTEKRLNVAKNAIAEAETFSRHAKEKLLSDFPEWKITAAATYGTPAWEILSRADEFKPDLIVIGSQGRNAVARILLGSVSLKVLSEATSSVRIARSWERPSDLPTRVLIGFDGSQGAELAVETVASRNWPTDTEVRLIWAAQTAVPTGIGRFVPPVREWVDQESEAEKVWVTKLAESSLGQIKDAGLDCTLEILEGSPKEVLTEAAAEWQANSIFVGAHSYSSTFEKIMIGCSSGAVAERAPCSVEVVRMKED